MEKQITITNNSSIIGRMFTNQRATTSSKAIEWLRQYYSYVMEREIDRRQTWSLLEVQAAFFAGIMPADYSLWLRAACCAWFLLALRRCRRLLQNI